jgi:putative SOS response-associated peptidase YedK
VLHADAEGALVLMAGLGQRRASVHHWGFLTARSRGGCRGIIHSHRQAGMVIEEPYSRTWQRMTCGHFELPG